MKKIAVLNDLSGLGKCSLSAALPVLSALGVQCCPLPSAVLTCQTGFKYYKCTDLTDMIPDYTHVWKQNKTHFDGIYSGYMTGRPQIEHFLDFLDEFLEDNTFLLVDPVMGDDGHTYAIFSPDLLEGMKTLSQKAHLITPNLTEACLLADMNPSELLKTATRDSLLALAEKLANILRGNAKQSQDVVITGIKCKDDPSPFIYNLTVTDQGTFLDRSFFFNRSFSGTGDLFASVLCGCKANGIPIPKAVSLASSFIYHSIADTMNDDVDPMEGVHFERHLIDLINGGLKYED